MITLEQILYIIPIVALAASITYYAMVIRNQNKTRQTQLFMNLYQVYRNKEFRTIYNKLIFEMKWNSYEDYWEKYGPETNPESFNEQSTVTAFFEGVGYLVKMGELSVESIYGLLAHPIINMFEKFKETNEEYGKSAGYYPYPYFKYLYEKTIEYKNKHPNR